MHLELGSPLSIEKLFGLVLKNKSPRSVQLEVMGRTLHIPPKSSFLMSDLSNVKPLLQGSLISRIVTQFNLSEIIEAPFDVILMDPPWPNRSVSRSKKYTDVDIYDLYKLPIKRLIKEGTFVAVWVTNRPKFQDFVTKKLFQSWGVEYITSWTWLKVTTKGDWIFPLKEGYFYRIIDDSFELC